MHSKYMEGKRSFTVLSVKRSATMTQKGEANRGGRFIASTPASAAKKAVSSICRQSNVRGQCSLIVTLQETTRGSAGKTFTYKVRRVLNPTTVVHDGVKVVHKYVTTVKALDLVAGPVAKGKSPLRPVSVTSMTGGFWF
jgi:hypothetical protein